MTTSELQPTEPGPRRPWLQFSLRTLLLLFVVLGSSLAVFGAWGIVVFGLVVGLAIDINRVRSLPLTVYVVTSVLCLATVAALVFHVVRARSPGVVCRSGIGHDLRDIAAALQKYHQVNGCFPPAYIADNSGKPMHSWRVLVLPYMYDLYPYDFKEPWDGRTNKKLSTASVLGTTRTIYVAVVGAGAAWAGEKSRKCTDFGADPSKTIMLVEADASGIGWAEPKDLSLEGIEAANGKSSLLAWARDRGRRKEFFFTYDYGSCVNVVTADGDEHCLRVDNRSAENLREVLQVGGFRKDGISNPERHLNWPNIAALAVWLLSVGMLLTHAVRSRKVLSVPPPL